MPTPHLNLQHHPDLCHFCGCLMLHDERPTGHDPAYPSQHIPAGPQLAAFEPGLCPQLAETCQHAKLYAQEGWCDPATATAAFLQDAQAAGAKVVYSQQVQTLVREGDRVTAVTSSSSSSQPGQPEHNQQQQQQQQQFPAHVVVLAAGVGTSELCEQLGYRLPLLHKPAAILLTSPLQPGTLQHMVVTDTVFILQRSDGRCLIGETQPTAAANTDTSDSNAARILGLAAAAVPALSGVAVGMQVGYRPYPADGLPVLGWVPGCSNAYVAVTHSGMTLAPLVGQLVADELLGPASTPAADTPATTTASSSGSTPVSADCSTPPAAGACGAAAQLLAPYRPDRDFDAAVAAAAAQPGLSWAATLRPGSSRE